jgi:hypothetical protein
MSRVQSLAALVFVVVVAISIGGVLALGRPASPPTDGNSAVGAAPPTDSQEGASTQDPGDGAEPDLNPDQPAEVPGGNCQSVAEVVDRVPPTIESMSMYRATAVVATVVEVGEAQWNTTDGKAPDRGSAFDVVRLLRLHAEDTIDGKDLGSDITVWVRGGTIGCSNFLYSDFPADIEPGQRYVLFLHEDQLETKLGGVVKAIQMWPVDGKDRVETPVEGPLALSEFTTKLRAASE